jgi:hypothetical protein
MMQVRQNIIAIDQKSNNTKVKRLLPKAEVPQLAHSRDKEIAKLLFDER